MRRFCLTRSPASQLIWPKRTTYELAAFSWALMTTVPISVDLLWREGPTFSPLLYLTTYDMSLVSVFSQFHSKCVHVETRIVRRETVSHPARE